MIGDTATTFGAHGTPGYYYWYVSRYGPEGGPTITWYRKTLFHQYMSGLTMLYYEQGADQFFKPKPGKHPVRLTPSGKATDEFLTFAEKHPERGVPYTPVAFLLDINQNLSKNNPLAPSGFLTLDRLQIALAPAGEQIGYTSIFGGSLVFDLDAGGDNRIILNAATNSGSGSGDMVANIPDKIKDKILAQIPLGRFGRPQEVAQAVVYLASDEAAFITGHVLNINGGMYL